VRCTGPRAEAVSLDILAVVSLLMMGYYALDSSAMMLGLCGFAVFLVIIISGGKHNAE
jgi:hypothetical protein